MTAYGWLLVLTGAAAWWLGWESFDLNRENRARRETLRKMKCRHAAERLERYGVDRLTDAQLERLLHDIFRQAKPSPIALRLSADSDEQAATAVCDLWLTEER